MIESQKFTPDPNLKIMDQVIQVLRYHHYSYSTEKTYRDWIIRFFKYFNFKIHPKDMSKKEIEEYLTYLAVNKHVSAATQKQATSAILFLFREVLKVEIDNIEHIRSKKRNPLPVVMSQEEVILLISQLRGTNQILAKLLYGSGLRLMEAIRLRVKDIDFDNNQILIYDGKRNKSRITVFPKSIQNDIKNQLQKVIGLHKRDIYDGLGTVWLPDALERKYPNASKEIQWQFVFPSNRISVDPRTGIKRRHHIMETSLQRSIKSALRSSKILKRVSCHTFRHCFATHLLENGANIRQVQKLMGHSDIKTTEIYLHVMETKIDVKSPLDSLVC